ncbi:MAG: dipeptidase [bacterium]
MKISNPDGIDNQKKEIDYLNLHKALCVVDGHSDLMIDIHRRHLKGEKAVFLNKYAEELKKGGVNVIILSTGGDSRLQNYNSDDPLWVALRRIHCVYRENEESQEVISLCTCFKELQKALAANKIAVFMMIEGAKPLRDDIAMVELYYRLGVRSITLTWNGRNLVGDGCGEWETNGRLTSFGKKVVREMNRLGMLVDVAHASESTFYSVAETSDSPFIVSHANAKALCNHKRNLSDEQIKMVAEKKGIIGICHYPDFLDLEKPSLNKLLDHIDYIVDIIGIDSIGLGPDFFDYVLDISPGILKSQGGEGGGYKNFLLPDEIKDVTTLPNLTRGLLQRGYSKNHIEKILGGNLIRLYKEVVG